MSTNQPAFFLVLFACVVGTAAIADEPPPKGYVCTRARTPVAVDGRLDDDAWKDAPWTDDFVDIEGSKKPRPRFRTRAKMLWDESYFYIAAELEEPDVWGTITKHDAVIFHDNDFEVFIDPDGDNHEYYEIEVNVLNAEWDLLLKKPYRDGGPAVNEWEIPGISTATQVNGTLNDPTDRDQSWTVELAIPWKALGEFAHRPAPPRDGDQWRVNFSRVEWRHSVEGKTYNKIPKTPEDNWVWSPQGLIDMHQPEHWGYVQFSNAPPGEATYKVDPSASHREQLMLVYHAQRAYRKRENRWAATLGALGLDFGAANARFSIRLIGDGYEASYRPEAQKEAAWLLREDSRLTRAEP